MVTEFFEKREHLGGKHIHQKMSVGDDHPKNLVRSHQDEHHLLNLKFHVTVIKACSGGSIHTLGHTLVNRLAVKSLRSL